MINVYKNIIRMKNYYQVKHLIMRQLPTTIIIVISILIFTSSFNFSYSQPFRNGDEIENLLKEADIPGMSLAYFEQNQITLSQYYGYRSVENQDLINEETIFSAASLSKPISAYIVLQLMEENKLDLDKPLHSYFEYPDLTHDKRYLEVTARMVLSHTSGLPNWRKGELGFSYAPGERFHYSGEGFVLLQKTVEKITGKSFEELAQERVFDPLKMNRSSYIWRDEFDDNFAIPHNEWLVTSKKQKRKETNIAYSLQTTANDYAKFLLAILNHKGLSAKTINLMLSSQVTVPTNDSTDEQVSWGLGVGLQNTKDGMEFWHYGDNNTFKGYFTVSLSDKKGLVYFANGSNGLSITPELVDLFIGTNQPGWKWSDYEHYQNPPFQLIRKIIDLGYEEAIVPYLNTRGFPDTSLIDLKSMDRIGHQLIYEKKFEDAKKVFLSNISSFSKSALVYGSYAKYCLVTGNFDMALVNYKKAISLSENNEKAKKMAKQLTQPMTGNVEFGFSGNANANLVSVVGQFNNWDETANLFRWKNGIWVCKMHFPPGEYRYKFAVDGVLLIDPNNLESVHNGRHHYSVLIVTE